MSAASTVMKPARIIKTHFTSDIFDYTYAFIIWAILAALHLRIHDENEVIRK